MKRNDKTTNSILRQKAEGLLKLQTVTASIISATEAEMLKLIHELGVHQIELELQNEELALAKQHEEITLQKSEEKFRQLAETSTILVYRILLKPEFKFEYVSPSATAITGYTPEDHYNDPQLGFKLVHPDDRILLENTTRYSNGEPLELRWIRKDGRIIWTEQRNILLFDSHNEPYAIEGNARDITDSKNIELGLRKDAERNSLLLGLFTKAPVLTDAELFDEVLDIAVKITDSEIGFFHQVSDNQQEIILTTWNDEAKKNCNAVYDNHYPLQKAGNWADCVRLKNAVVYNDYTASPNKKGLPEGHAPIGRTMIVPVLDNEKVRLIFGVGNKSSDYTDSDVVQIQTIANEMYKILEKRKVEKELQKSEERWHFAIEGSNDGIWDWNVLTGEVYFSNRWKEMIGYGPAELEGKLSEWQSRVHPDDLEAVVFKLQNHFNRETLDYSSEHRVLCKDGSWKWIMDRGKVLEWNRDGKPVRMVGTHTDITDRKKTEEKIREAEVQYRNLADAGSALIWTSGTDKLCNYFNETWLRFTGRTLKQEMGNGWTEGVHPEDFDRCLETYITSFDKHVPFEMEYRLRHSSGGYRWLVDLGTPNFNSTGEFVGYIGHCFDISERKKTELALQVSEEKYRSIFESVQEVYFEASLDGTLLEVSPSIEKISKGQFTRNEMIGKSFAGIYANPVDRNVYFSKLFEYKRVNDFELSLLNKDGSIIPVAISSVLSFDTNGNPVKITGILRDIAERKNAENKLNQTLRKLSETNLHLERRVEERTLELRQLSNLQQAILRHAGLAIISTSTEGLIEQFNNAAEEMLGYKANEVVGKSTPVLFHEPQELVMRARELSMETSENIPSDFSVFQTILKGSLNQTGEWTYVRKGGGRFPVKLTLSSIKDQDGKLLGYIGLAIDITKEKQSISALRESEERFHNMFWDHSAVMILVNPENGEIIEANKAAEQFYGIPFNNGPRLLVSDLNTLSSDQVKEEMEKASLQKRNYFIFRHKLANGEIRTVEVHSSPIDVKGSKVLFSVIHDITERKVLEAALRMQSAAFESFAMTIIITDIQGRIQWVNPAFTQLTGYSVDEAIGKMPGELVKSGLQDKEFYKKFWDTLLNKEVWSGELINRRKDGSLYYEEETITPVLDTQGNISSFIAIKIDITERKKLYQELADEKRRLADIIKGTNVGTWEWNVQTGETRFNEQWANMIGYTLDEISPISIETWMRFAHPDDLKRSAELLEEHFKGELDYYSFESRMKHKNGNWIWVLDRGRVHDWDSEGKPFLMSGTHQDITERKKAEEKLQWNKSFLELMSNSSPLGFLVVDNRNDEILFFNHRFCQIWEIEQLKDQLTRGELKNNDIIPYCLAVLADIPAFAESCKPLQDEANRIVVEDEIAFTENRTVRRFTTQIRGGNDEYFGRFYIFEDITKRKRAESDLKKARNEAEKANHAKSEFLSRMSHELRTPMNSILGFAQLMDMGELNSKQKKGIKHIMNNGRHLLSLINDVLDISGIEAGRQILTPEPVQLAAIINEITDSIQIAANKRKVSIVLVDSPANSLFALADKLRLKQILINLLSNAIKYNNEGGSVTIKIAVQPTNESGRCPVKISICDTGNGIRPEDIGKLFQAFERIGADQTETEGTGLGLMVVKKLIEVMGGKVGVESVVGTGSTFWIELPISNNSKQDMSQTNGSPTPGLQETKHDTTILYIEDNPSNIELVEAIIEQHCPEIRLVTSIHGKQTLPLAKEYKPGLIMLDLNLPDMPGIDVLEQLLADDHTKAIPVIIISADAMPFQIEKLIKAGATDYLTKPLDIVQFLKTIEQHLNN